jgi:hypothetical protein
MLDDNLASVDLHLSAEELRRLTAVMAPPTIYPDWMVERQNHGRDPA